MNVADITIWRGEHGRLIRAPAEAIWRRFADVPGWKRWNAGIERIEIEGPFMAGTEFVMQPPGQEPFRSRLLEVFPGERFVDETAVGDVLVRVSHNIEPLDDRRCRVVFVTEVFGPGASEIGCAVSADFPSVLRALAEVVTAAEAPIPLRSEISRLSAA